MTVPQNDGAQFVEEHDGATDREQKLAKKWALDPPTPFHIGTFIGMRLGQPPIAVVLAALTRKSTVTREFNGEQSLALAAVTTCILAAKNQSDLQAVNLTRVVWKSSTEGFGGPFATLTGIIEMLESFASNWAIFTVVQLYGAPSMAEVGDQSGSTEWLVKEMRNLYRSANTTDLVSQAAHIAGMHRFGALQHPESTCLQ
jgi:hypothetical protein